MEQDNLRQFVTLRQSLIAEEAALKKRLAEIEAALGGQLTKVNADRAMKRGPQIRNELSLKEAIIKVTSSKPMTRDEILEAVQKLGYKFYTINPMGSISSLLYGKKNKFKNEAGKFSPE
jgi:hypothetical protein